MHANKTWIRSHGLIVLGLLVLNLVIFIECIRGYHDDYYTLNIDLKKFMEEVPNGMHSKIDTDNYFSLSLSGEKEAVLPSGDYRVPSGYYYVYVEYETEHECSLESYSESYVNQDNTLGNTFGGLMLDPDHTTAEGPIWLDTDASDMNILLHYNGGATTIYKIRIQSMKPYPDKIVLYILFLLLEIVTGMIYFRHGESGGGIKNRNMGISAIYCTDRFCASYE